MKQHKIKEIFEVVSGSTPSTSQEKYWDGNIKWITPKDLSKLSSAVISETERQITRAGLESCSTHIIPKDSIIISSRAPIGYVAILGDEMCCNQGCKALVPIQKINPNYFYYLLKTKNKQLNDLGTGSTFKELSKAKLEDFKVRITDLQSQNEISSLLTKIDKVRQLRKQANALTDQFLQSTFLSMFGDPVSNLKGWTVKKIGDVTDNIIAGKSVQSESRKISSSEYGVLKVSAVTYGIFKPEEHKAIVSDFIPDRNIIPRKGDLLFSRANTKEMVAATCIVDRDYPKLFLPDKLWKIVLDQKIVLPWFFKYVLSQSSYRAKLSEKATGTSGSMFNISQGKLLEFLLPTPPIKLQTRFADIVIETEELRQKQRVHEQELDQLFKGLLQKYFG